MRTRTVNATVISENIDEGTAYYELEIKLPELLAGEFVLDVDGAKIAKAYVWGQQVWIEIEASGHPANRWGQTMEEYLT